MKRVFRNLSYLNKFAKMLRDARFRQHRLNSKKRYSRKGDKKYATEQTF